MAHGVNTLYPLKCFYCRQFISVHVKCAFCGVAVYCNHDHQSLHWEIHQSQCKAFRGEPKQDVQFVVTSCDNVQTSQYQNVPIDMDLYQPSQNLNMNFNLQNQPNLTLNTNLNLNQQQNLQTNFFQPQQLPLQANLMQSPATTNPQPVPKVLCTKSCCTFPVYDTPNGISKEEIIKRHADYLVKCLTNDGYCVIDGLLGETKFNAIISDVENLLESGVMKNGQLIEPKSNQKGHIRGDKIAWVSGEEDNCRNIKVIINVLDHLVGYCEGRLPQLIKGRTQAMVACYKGDGVGYKYHIDNAHKDGRCLSCLYYVNKDWDSERNGGMLKLYPLGKSSYTMIDPEGDRLLVFWSDSRTPHEVLPPYHTRFAITLWYFDAKEREEVRKRYITDLQDSFTSS